MKTCTTVINNAVQRCSKNASRATVRKPAKLHTETQLFRILNRVKVIVKCRLGDQKPKADLTQITLQGIWNPTTSNV